MIGIKIKKNGELLIWVRGKFLLLLGLESKDRVQIEWPGFSQISPFHESLLVLIISEDQNSFGTHLIPPLFLLMLNQRKI